MTNLYIPTMPYDPFRKRLTIWQQDEIFVPLINQIGHTRDWWTTNPGWKRTYGRFQPDEAPNATMLFEAVDRGQHICMAETFDHRPEAETHRQHCLYDERTGWLRFTCFPHDPKLPTLEPLLEIHSELKVIRYRPYQRCMMRLDGTEGQPTYFVKVFKDLDSVRVHRDGQALWRASKIGEVDFLVAEPGRWEPNLRAVWQGVVPGQSVRPKLFGAKGAFLARRMGSAAASIPLSNLAPEQYADRKVQLEKLRRNADKLRRRLPWLQESLVRLTETIGETFAATHAHPPRPIHGAPHMHQWLDNGERLGLVDFDGFAWGDPEFDVATFMAEMDFENWNTMRVEEILRNFIAGYEAVAGPLDHRLLNAYRAQKRLSKAIKHAYKIRPDSDLRAEAAVGRALVCAYG